MSKLLDSVYNTENDYEVGVDECARGPMFGRLYTAAAILPKDNFDLTWKWLKSENYPFWGILADVDSKIVGFAHFRSLPSPLDSCEVGFLDDLFVLQEYRGKKIGYSLIEKVHQIGKSKNWPYINWITKDDNYTARTLYDKISTKTDWNFYELTVKS